MSQGYDYLRGTCSGIPRAGISVIPYPRRLTVTSVQVTIGDVVQQYSIAPLIDMGKASHDLHLVPQGLATVWRVQGQHPLLTKGDWGPAAYVRYIRLAFEATVPPITDARCSHLSIPLG